MDSHIIPLSTGLSRDRTPKLQQTRKANDSSIFCFSASASASVLTLTQKGCSCPSSIRGRVSEFFVILIWSLLLKLELTFTAPLSITKINRFFLSSLDLSTITIPYTNSSIRKVPTPRLSHCFVSSFRMYTRARTE